jgi:hypothetical protein
LSYTSTYPKQLLSSIHKIHHQLVTRCFYVYYMQLLHVSAKYLDHLQGVTRWQGYMAKMIVGAVCNKYKNIMDLFGGEL